MEARARRIYALALLHDTAREFSADGMGPLAASLSYSSLFALFPLLLLLIAIASPFEPTTKVISLAVGFLSAYLPTAQIALQRILEGIVAERGPATLVALIALIWSASGFSNVLQLTMSRAWAVRTPRPMLLQRAVSVGIVAVAGLLFMVSLFISTTTRMHLKIYFFLGNERVELIALVGSLIVNVLVFFALYKVLPAETIHWRDLRIGWSCYWVADMGYISAAILLFCAELAAVRAKRKGLGVVMVVSQGGL